MVSPVTTHLELPSMLTVAFDGAAVVPSLVAFWLATAPVQVLLLVRYNVALEMEST